jgi:type I restriction enzyme S subunit
MSKWKEHKFSDFVEINPTVSMKAAELYSFVEMKDLQDGNKFCFPSAERNPSSGARFKEGDTLFARITPCLENGKICKVKGLKNGIGFGSTEFLVFRGKENVSDNDFVFYLSRWDEVRGYAESRFEGTSGRQRVPKNCFDNLFLNLPPLPEQTAIAEVLSSLDDKIDLLHRQNKTLEQLAETLFRQWFVEEAEESWEVGHLGDFVNIVYGKNLPTKYLLPAGYPVFGGNGQIGFYNRYLYEKPQVLVSCRGEASGVVNISLEKSFVTNNSLVLEIGKRPEITFEFLKYYSLNTDFKRYVTGSAQPQITIEGLYQAIFVLPPKDLIDKFSEIVNPWELKRTKNQYQISTLTQLRDTLLPKLMSGEIRLNYDF